jgi:hypothetical protein
MRGTRREAIAVAIAAALFFFPISGTAAPSQLVGVAQAAGEVEINGQPLAGQTSIFSGDRLHVGLKSQLTVICGPQERMRFAGGTAAQLLKDQDATVIGFDAGTMDFQTQGKTRAVIGQTGVEVRPATSSVTLAEVALLSPGHYQVAVAQGALEVSGDGESVIVTPGHAALINPDDAPAASPQAPSTVRSRHKGLIVLTVAAINAGIIAWVLAGEQSKKVSPLVP